MALIVEDGTGVIGAESYLDRSVLELKSEAYGLTLPDASNEDYEAALRRGTLAFEAIYAPRFPGRRFDPRQGLAFPMHDIADPRGYLLEALPDAVITAVAVMARQELVAPFGLFPTVTPGKQKESFTADQVSVKYALSGGDVVQNARPVLSIVEGILSKIVLLPSVGGRTFYGSAVRG